MKCFNHPSIDAVAICKNCNKGVCIDCAVDVGDGVACKGECEEKVKAINLLIQKNKGAFNTTSNIYKKAAFMFIIVGMCFIIFGVFVLEPVDKFLITLGVIFIFGAVLNYNIANKFKNPKN